MPSDLPPLPKEAFDGENQSSDIPKDLPRCQHKQVAFKNGELRCTCGSAWQGTNLYELYKLFTA